MSRFTTSATARNRRCPKCGRGMAMQHDHETGGRFCRWCGHETRPIVAERCDMPPEGWWCSRPKGHDGPCAARQGDAPAPGQPWCPTSLTGHPDGCRCRD